MHAHPKFGIKIPRLLVITNLQRKSHFHVKDKATATANDTEYGSIRPKHGNQFSTKSVGSVFFSVLGNKTSKVKKNGLRCIAGPGRALSNELGNNLACGDEPTLSQLLTLEQTLDPDRGGEGNKNRKDKHRVKMNFPLLSFLDKKKGWNNFIRTKMRSNGDGAVTTLGHVKRKASLWRLVRIPSKILVIRLKLKMLRSLAKKKVTKQFEEGDGEDKDRELCKKRILMGGRCKPLNSSGTLSYDSDGLFLPEIVP
ncbi:hypothetical protein SESBI_43391 [Sesbania bispinosa]|nr:hypothetical protein SESBI_43391 [Sesbania bispinosa]